MNGGLKSNSNIKYRILIFGAKLNSLCCIRLYLNISLCRQKNHTAGYCITPVSRPTVIM